MLRTLIAALLGLTAAAQSQIDPPTQAKRVDFTGATSIKPMKTGVALPTTGVTGDMFFNTVAAAGSNLYSCTATNTWTLEGGFPNQNCWYNPTAQTLQCQNLQGQIFTAVRMSSSGTLNQWVDYISSAGIPHTSQPTAPSVGAVSDPETNGVPYRNGPGMSAAATADQMGGPFSCQDAGSTSAYACSLNPAIGGYTPGTTYWFKANTANNGPATINFNALGAKTIKKLSNQDLAANHIKTRQWVMATYDGTNMQMQSQIANAPSGGAISTVFGRTGTVTAMAGDYSANQITGLAPSATTDTTNAGNISSGTLGAAWLPPPTVTTLVGIESLAATSHKWINTISTTGIPSTTQPTCGGPM